MNKLFHRLSTRILLGILLAAAISAVVYTAANGALKAFFQYYAMQPEVFQRLSDEHFADLQDFATENRFRSCVLCGDRKFINFLLQSLNCAVDGFQ